MIILKSYLLGLVLPTIAALVIVRFKIHWPLMGATIMVPLLVWEYTRPYVGAAGTLSNALAEPFVLGFGIGMTILAWALVKRKRVELPLASTVHCLWVSVLMAMLIVLFFPSLPE